jgi:hypothetical protein
LTVEVSDDGKIFTATGMHKPEYPKQNAAITVTFGVSVAGARYLRVVADP